MCGEVHNPQQAPPPSWKVAVPEQITAASSAYEIHGAFETHSGPVQATQAWNSQNARQRDSADAQVPPLEAQLAVDKLRLAAQIATSQQALSMVVSSAGTEWREELVQALELVAVVMKDKLASLHRPRVSLHI